MSTDGGMQATGEQRSNLQRLLPDYDLEGEIGRGQHGVVWRGRHHQLHRPVAVKQLAIASGEHTARFRREARVLAQVDHPHVVSVYDYREDGDLRVIVMELLGGGTFADRLKAGLPPVSAVAAVLSAATGLAQVHAQGILHRDVKPENLMFDTRGRLEVTDFGLAREDLVDATAMNLTHAGTFFGTPAYVSPEQVGNALATGWPPVSAASDQYSLAAVLYQALSGRLTHDDAGGVLALCNRRMNEEAAPLGQVAPQVPAPIAEVVERGLRRDPGERYPSVEELGVALAHAAVEAWGPDWLAGSDVPLLSAGPVLRAATGPPVPPAPADAPSDPVATEPTPRRGRLLVAVGLVVVVVAGGAFALLRPDQTSGEGTEESTTELATGDTALDLVEVWSVPTGGAVFSSPAVASDDGETRVVVGSKDGSVYGIDAASGEIVWERATGGPVRSSPTIAEGRVYVASDDGFLYDLAVADGSVGWRAPTGIRAVSQPAVADGIVVLGADHLYAFDAATGEPRWEFTTDDVIASSPAILDGTVFVGSNDGNVYAVSLADGTERWVRRSSSPVQSSPVVLGDTVYVGSTDGSLLAIDAATGADRWLHDLGSSIQSSPAIDGSLLFVGTDAGRLVALETETGDEAWVLSAPDRLDSSPVVLDGQVVIGCNDGRVYVASADAGELLGSFTTGGPVQSSPAAVEHRVTVGSDDGSVYLIGGLD